MFGKRFNIFTLAGFKIGVDVSWFFIAILITWTLAAGYFPFYYRNLNLETYWLMGLLGMLGLFSSVVLHELGHAIVAKRFGLEISQITLFIFGGVAEMKKEPPNPKVEFLVAIAGPIVSLCIAVFMQMATMIGEQREWPVLVTGVTAYIAAINIIVVIFNLLPAFPLDGGRLFRALLWWWKNNLGWATKISTNLGEGFGFALIFFGILSFMTGNLFVGLWWIIIGIFLSQAASATKTQFFISRELRGEKVDKLMTKNPITVSPHLTIKDFINDYVYQSHHHLYPVTFEGKLLGWISLKEVKSLSMAEWEKTRVEQVMVPRSLCPVISSDTHALDALNLIQHSHINTLLVGDHDQLVGILTAQDLFKLISLKLELEEEFHT